MTDIETGDKGYADRVAKYRDISDRLAGAGAYEGRKQTKAQVAREYGVSRQAIDKIVRVKGLRPRPTGQPRRPGARAARLTDSLKYWTGRRAEAIAAGRDTAAADRRIAALEGEIRGLAPR